MTALGLVCVCVCCLYTCLFCLLSPTETRLEHQPSLANTVTMMSPLVGDIPHHDAEIPAPTQARSSPSVTQTLVGSVVLHA